MIPVFDLLRNGRKEESHPNSEGGIAIYVNAELNTTL